MGNRLRQITSMILAAGFLLAGMPPLHAQEEKSPEEVIREIKAQPEFKVFQEETRVRPPALNSPPGYVAKLLGSLGVLLFWLFVAALVSGLVFLCWRYRHLFRSSPQRLAGPAPSRHAKVVMGMNVTPESLPEDIPNAVMEIWQTGRHHEALSLLYRSAISRLIEAGKVEIAESDTESDCLRRVQHASPGHVSWFAALTGFWMQLAYARLHPADGEIRELCAAWPFASVERRKR